MPESRHKADLGTCECIQETLGGVGPACAKKGKRRIAAILLLHLQDVYQRFNCLNFCKNKINSLSSSDWEGRRPTTSICPISPGTPD